jgi:hypothetical protein
MDHTLTLNDSTAAAGLPVAASPVPGASVPADEDPESPGRSPGGTAAASSPSDPLSDGLALLAGVAIALTAVVVPLITVVCEPRPLEPLGAARATR